MDQSSEKHSSSTTEMENPSDQTKTPPTEEKLDKLKIILDNPNHTYHSGQTIRGTITINCAQKTKIRGIYYRIYGYGKCSWIGSETTTGTGKNDKSIAFANYAGKEEYLDATNYIIGSKNGHPFPLLGSTSYSFSFDLKPDLPSTFSSSIGKIKYKMDFVVNKSWSFDEKQTILLNIIQTMNLNSVPNMLQPYQCQQTKNVGIKPMPISLHVSLPKRGFSHGETIPVQATLSNKSKVNIQKLKCAVYQIVDYYGKTPKPANKTETKRILKKEFDVAGKLFEQKIEHNFDVPLSTTPTQGENISQMIQIKYELKVEAKLGALYKNLSAIIPITFGNVPFNPDEVVLRSHSSSAQFSDASRQSVFSNWSVDYQNGLNRSSTVPAMGQIYPTSPVAPGPLPTSYNSMSPMNSSPYQPNSRTSVISNTSFGSLSNYSPMYPNLNSPYPTSAGYNPMYSNQSAEISPNTYRASAPPMEFAMTSTPIQTMTFAADRPPSYDEVFARQFNQLNMSSTPLILDMPKKC